MNFPQQVGITEIYFEKPKFPVTYLEYIGKKTTSYFPPGFLKISPLEPISIDNKTIAKEEVYSLLANLKEENNLDMVGGLSLGVCYSYVEEKSKKLVRKKINEANTERKVFICGNRRPKKVTMPRVCGHEITHTIGLEEHEMPSLWRKVFLTLTKGFKLRGVIEFAEREGNINLSNPQNGLMICSLDFLEKDGFSKKHYEFFERLMKENKG